MILALILGVIVIIGVILVAVVVARGVVLGIKKASALREIKGTFANR